jgi:hypothetical protein
MALGTDARTLNDIVTAALPEFRPDLVDGVFNSNPFLARLMAKEKVLLDGGEEIRCNIIYDKLPGGWYSGLGPFSTSTKETFTPLRFFWKQVRAEITLPEIDLFKNMGPHKIFDLLGGKMAVAKMTLADLVGTALYNDGTDIQQPLGLRLATIETGTYGEIARGTDALGTAVKGNTDATGGAITLPFLNAQMGEASAGGAQKPDLLLTTQTLWDAIWARVQPQQRFTKGSGEAWDVGTNYIEINGSTLVADSHCPTGYVFGVNTDFAEFYVGQGKDFYFRGPFPFPDQDGLTGQLILYCALAITAPRMTFNASGLVA